MTLFLRKTKAFTLSELLMSVLVISIVMVAMAPVITKRVSDNISVADVKYEGQLFTTNTYRSTSELEFSCSDTENNGAILNYNKCQFTIPENVRSINAIVLSAGGGGGGAASPYRENRGISGNNGAFGSVTIEQNMRQFKLSSLYSAGGGGGGAAFKIENKPPSSQEDCEVFNAIYLETNSTDSTGICMTKYNVGDSLGPKISGMLIDPVIKDGSWSFKTCWGNDFTASAYSESRFSSQTVCSWSMANEVCNNYSVSSDSNEIWSLPTSGELEIVAEQMISKANELNLCSNSTSNTNYCTNKISGSTYCYGNGSNGCRPSALWSSDSTGTTNYYYSFNWNNSTYEKTSTNMNYGLSSRCILRNISNKASGAMGGGGGAGHTATIEEVPNDIIKECIGGVLRYGTAKIPQGGKTSLIPDSKGQDGYKDRVWQYDDYASAYGPSGSPYMRNAFSKNLDDDDAFGNYYNDASYFLFYRPASKDPQKHVFWGVYLINGHPGYGADCTGNVCIAGSGGQKEEATYKFNDYIHYCNYFDRRINDNAALNVKYDCQDSPDIQTMHGTNGENGAFYSDARQMVGSTYSTIYSGDSGLGGAGWDFRYNRRNPNLAPTSGGQADSLKYTYNTTLSAPEIIGSFSYTDATTGDIYYSGKEGGRGQIQASYKIFYPVSGGAGGASGNIIQIENLEVSPNEEIEIRIGKGGAGGAAGTESTSTLGYRAVGQSGSAGGESGIITNSRTYITQGGNGGGAGQYSTSSTTDVSRPNGGTIGGYSVPDATTTQDGNAGSMPIFIKSNGNITQAFGGMGGKSPTGTFGGCGGLYVYSQDPNGTADENSDPRCNNQETAGLKSDIIMPTNLHNSQDFGSAGAGGGGGGWDFDHAREQGSGGAGQPGYVYIYWAKVD